MIIGFTGTRWGLTDLQHDTLRNFLVKLSPTSITHGGCHGADTTFHNLAYQLNPQVYIIIYPGDEKQASRDWQGLADVQPIRPYLLRNKDIVNTSDLILATPRYLYEELRSGTWAAIRYARKVSKPMYIIFPDGTTSKS